MMKRIMKKIVMSVKLMIKHDNKPKKAAYKSKKAAYKSEKAAYKSKKADNGIISIAPDEITRLNDGYRRGEQARTNYYWASDFRNAFFGRLGFGELLERINHDISRYVELSDVEKKEF